MQMEAGILVHGGATGLADFTAVNTQSVFIELPSGACRVLNNDALITAKPIARRPQLEIAIVRLLARQEN